MRMYCTAYCYEIVQMQYCPSVGVNSSTEESGTVTVRVSRTTSACMEKKYKIQLQHIRMHIKFMLLPVFITTCVITTKGR